jgi:hypothetical protein
LSWLRKYNLLAILTTVVYVLLMGLTMIAVCPIINAKLQEELLSPLYYRISVDYGRVEVAAYPYIKTRTGLVIEDRWPGKKRWEKSSVVIILGVVPQF